MRKGVTLVEVLVASVVMVVMIMVFQGLFHMATRGEGRDVRRTQALGMAQELMEQVLKVYDAKQDLPLMGPSSIDPPTGTFSGEKSFQKPASFRFGHTLYTCPGGELQLSRPVKDFQRILEIRNLHEGEESPIMRSERSYEILVRVRYPGPIGEPREELLVNTRGRPLHPKTRWEQPPWL